MYSTEVNEEAMLAVTEKAVVFLIATIQIHIYGK